LELKVCFDARQLLFRRLWLNDTCYSKSVWRNE